MKLCFEEIIVKEEFDCNLFLERSIKLDLSRFYTKRRIYNYINEIIGACYNFKNKKRITKYFKKYISDKLFSILKVINNQKYQLIKKYQNLNKEDDSYYLKCVFSDDKSELDKIIENIKISVNKDLVFLSKKPSLDTDYIDAIKLIKKQCRQQLPKFMEKDRCFAIAVHNESIYFSFSGCWDIPGQISQEMEDTVKNINTSLFNGKGKWCILTNNVYNYIEDGSLKDENKCIYKITPEPFSGKNKGAFSCCERKILGESPELKKYDLFVMYLPCFKCAKPLFKNYNRIICLLDYSDERRKIKYKEDLFNPKEYKIIFEDNHYKTRVK